MKDMEHTEYEAENEFDSEQFEITDDATAEWAIKKVLAAKKEKERLSSLIEAERAELDRKQEKIEKRYETETGFLLFKLNAYLDTVDRKKTKTQETYQLLSGKLVRKFAKKKLVADETALLEWCKENAPECVKTTEKAMWSEVKGKFDILGDTVICSETGECVSCVRVEETPAAFDVKGE